ncbi:Hypp8142 [Branchiostoma lanceolatum]|uniref:Hypp8142 protein n=1 Tax=Branchiostoma lanceolatum TaxID=7740 RepID=A0A8J9Z7A4_BRALA|nr:Hypp8142 [Branchiostoma lanceolatum]
MKRRHFLLILFKENTEPQHVTKGPGCTPGHAATAVTDSSPGHAGSGNVEAVGAAGVRGHQDWQKLRNTQAENQPVDLHTTANHQHTEDLTAAKRIGTAPVSAGITANKRAETLKNTRTGKPSELEKQQVGFQPSQFKWIMDEQTDGSPCSGDSVSPGSETSTEFPAEIVLSKLQPLCVVGYHGNPVNSLAEEIRLAETEDGGQKSQTESETVSQTDEHTENFLSTRHTTSSLEHSPSTLPDNSGPVKHPARGKKSSIPRRESTDSEKEEAGNSRRDALSRHPPLNGSGGGGKRTNSKTTKSKVSSKSQSMAPGGGSKAGMSGKRISRSTTSLPDGQHGNSSAQRGAQLPSLEETARLQDSTEKNMTWPKQKKTTKEDKKEELNNFRRTSSLRLPTKEKASFKRSVSFRLTERSESMSSLGSEASVGSKSDQPVSAAVAATRESVKKEWERRLHPHCPVPAPEPDKVSTPSTLSRTRS